MRTTADPEARGLSGDPASGNAEGERAGGDPAIRARLYDARGEDRPVDLVREPPARLADDQLLWIDVDGRSRPALEAAGRAVGLDPATVADLAAPGAPLALRRHDEYVHLGVRSAQAGEAGAIDVAAFEECEQRDDAGAERKPRPADRPPHAVVPHPRSVPRTPRGREG